MRRGQKTSAEQVVLKLRQIEVQTAQGKSLALACKEADVSEQSYYRWRKEYGGLQVDQARKMKDLERENARLRRLVADLSLEKQVLADVAAGDSGGAFAAPGEGEPDSEVTGRECFPSDQRPEFAGDHVNEAGDDDADFCDRADPEPSAGTCTCHRLLLSCRVAWSVCRCSATIACRRRERADATHCPIEGSGLEVLEPGARVVVLGGGARVQVDA